MGKYTSPMSFLIDDCSRGSRSFVSQRSMQGRVCCVRSHGRIGFDVEVCSRPLFAETRNRSSQEVFDSTSMLLREAKINDQSMEVYLRSARRSFVDDALMWPLHASRCYLGLVPAINCPTQISPILATRIAHVWHIASIRLAGQNWGTYRRTVNPVVGKVQRTIDLLTHLRHLQPCS
ncbi:hypothetical protein EDB19DRAFT_277946 [Suillus lakei]|nr:hypothetical protein EDB19DRAFT_277946 [Suillus lakei]